MYVFYLYSTTLFDSRLVLFGLNKDGTHVTSSDKTSLKENESITTTKDNKNTQDDNANSGERCAFLVVTWISVMWERARKTFRPSK